MILVVAMERIRERGVLSMGYRALGCLICADWEVSAGVYRGESWELASF